MMVWSTKTSKGAVMRILVTCLLSAVLILTIPSKQTPINNMERVGESKTVSATAPEKVVQVATPKTTAKTVTPPVVSEKTQPTPAVTPVAVATPVISTPKAQAQATLKDLGHEDAWYAVEYIGFKESSWNPTAINSIGACGLFQALPCSKLKCELSNVDCQVRWATKYATTRYGSWHQAYAFWKANNWW
jgi:hypothetical protein